MARKKARRSVENFQVHSTGKVISAGECVILRPPDPTTQPYIAKVERIEVDNSDTASLVVRWYYRPEESVGGRREFHGSKELFLSDHFDECSPEAVESKCTVHSFKEYIRLENVGTEDFFCRFEYKAAAGTFSPDRVAVYCKCEMPYNPDDLMVQCEQCKDCGFCSFGLSQFPESEGALIHENENALKKVNSFHPRCIKRTAEEIKGIGNFSCPDCAGQGN